MADPEAFFPATWGRIRLWVAEVVTNNGRKQVVHDITEGDTHPVQDRGLDARRPRLTLLFDDMDGEATSPTERFRRLKAEVDAGTRAIYTHPIDGGFLARVGAFDYTINADSTITNVTIEFIADEFIEAISPAGAGVAGLTGEGAIGQAADDLDNELEAAGFTTNRVTADARAAADTWVAGEDVPTRQIMVDTANTGNALALMIDELDLENDLAKWGIFRSAILFGDAVRSAAIAATSEVSTCFVLHVVRPTVLLALCARTYGGREAEDRARQVVQLNDIRTRAWLPEGDYLFPAKSIATSASF